MIEAKVPSTEIVKARYHLAAVPDDITPEIDRRMRAQHDLEFEVWKEALKEELREEIRQESAASSPAAAPASGLPVEPGSIADIYSQSPFSPILIEALDHKPGNLTSETFQRGYFAALAVAHVRGAAALESFGGTDWEYGWRSFFSNGEECEWFACYSREAALQQIADYQFEENASYPKGPNTGRLTYSLWRRQKSQAGPWEKVEESTDV